MRENIIFMVYDMLKKMRYENLKEMRRYDTIFLFLFKAHYYYFGH